MACLKVFFKNRFSVDLLGLALMRIFLGLAMLYDVFDRWRNAEAFYSSSGFAPLDEVLRLQSQFSFSILYVFDSTVALNIFFSLYLVLALSFLFGFKTRWCAGLLWIIVQSLYYRNEFVSYGLDNFLISFLTIGFFLPLEERLSLSRVRSLRNDDESGVYFSWATVALVLQVITIYSNAAFHKLADPIWRSGAAVNNALMVQPTVYPDWLLNPFVTHFLSHFTIVAQLSILLVVFAFKGRSLKLIPFVLIALLHVGMFFLMDLGALPLAGLAAIMTLYPFYNSHSQKTVMAVADQKRNLVFKCIPIILVFILVIHNVQLAARPIWQMSPVPWGPLSLFQRHQDWVFYAPMPENRFWFVIRAEDTEGQDWELLSRKPFRDFQRPTSSANIGHIRWSIFLRQIANEGYLVIPFSNFICRKSEQTRLFQYYHVLQKISEYGQSDNPIEKKLIFSHRCDR